MLRVTLLSSYFIYFSRVWCTHYQISHWSEKEAFSFLFSFVISIFFVLLGRSVMTKVHLCQQAPIGNQAIYDVLIRSVVSITILILLNAAGVDVTLGCRIHALVWFLNKRLCVWCLSRHGRWASCCPSLIQSVLEKNPAGSVVQWWRSWGREPLAVLGKWVQFVFSGTYSRRKKNIRSKLWNLGRSVVVVLLVV